MGTTGAVQAQPAAPKEGNSGSKEGAETTLPSGPGTTQDIELARQHVDLAEKLYRRGDYEHALEQFVMAYRIVESAQLAYNIGRCHEALGNFEDAITWYQRYLDAGKAKDAGDVRTRIEMLRARLQKKQEEEKKLKALESERNAAAQRVTQANAALAPAPKVERGSSTLGWVVLGSGVGLLAVGGVLSAMVASKESSLEDDAKSFEEYSAVKGAESDGRTLETLQWISLGVGAAGAAVGGFLLWRHYSKDNHEQTPSRVSVMPSLGPNAASVQALFRF